MDTKKDGVDTNAFPVPFLIEDDVTLSLPLPSTTNILIERNQEHRENET